MNVIGERTLYGKHWNSVSLCCKRFKGSTAVDNAPPQKSSDIRLRIFYLQFVQNPHKETPFLSCTIRVQSGRNRKTSSQDAMQAMKTAHLRQKPGGAAPLKKHCPLLMRGNSQGSGQTTNHLLTAANVWEFSYTASAAFSSFPRRWLFLFGSRRHLSGRGLSNQRVQLRFL